MRALLKIMLFCHGKCLKVAIFILDDDSKIYSRGFSYSCTRERHVAQNFRSKWLKTLNKTENYLHLIYSTLKYYENRSIKRAMVDGFFPISMLSNVKAYMRCLLMLNTCFMKTFVILRRVFFGGKKF